MMTAICTTSTLALTYISTLSNLHSKKLPPNVRTKIIGCEHEFHKLLQITMK